MGMFRNPWAIVLLILLVVLLFGAGKLPGLARNLGQSMRIFKSEVEEMRGDDRDEDEDRHGGSHRARDDRDDRYRDDRDRYRDDRDRDRYRDDRDRYRDDRDDRDRHREYDPRDREELEREPVRAREDDDLYRRD
ncbi:Sec-independent protein translocase subunit TatA [Brachybacterium sp. p3-SID957]|uniref:Sec-independent protein translocase subunit TatA n=1 Tax=Brachybacterium sp. p3-SID957 TaxID=2916049 RepID=UPI0021E3C45B|nr:Sec-independent protein translocase subunit TatA [Brachybacterium sp. p3-SID957]MCT1775268.1 Sec-independent protein translocase subunit TatA [Brachybacterium sp. p3-SID957]